MGVADEEASSSPLGKLVAAETLCSIFVLACQVHDKKDSVPWN
jgi:hypothetical protein